MVGSPQHPLARAQQRPGGQRHVHRRPALLAQQCPFSQSHSVAMPAAVFMRRKHHIKTTFDANSSFHATWRAKGSHIPADLALVLGVVVLHARSVLPHPNPAQASRTDLERRVRTSHLKKERHWARTYLESANIFQKILGDTCTLRPSGRRWRKHKRARWTRSARGARQSDPKLTFYRLRADRTALVTRGSIPELSSLH